MHGIKSAKNCACIQSMNKILFFIIDIYCIKLICCVFFGRYFFFFSAQKPTKSERSHCICNVFECLCVCGSVSSIFCFCFACLTILNSFSSCIGHSRIKPDFAVTFHRYDRSSLCTHSLILKKPLTVLACFKCLYKL